ncbi:MAG: methyltransferase domain-containing protein [Rhizobiaceae bacterium]
MAELFDAYRSSYRQAVQESIGFSGLKHDFFLRAKADLLGRLAKARGLGHVKALDIGCGIGALHPFLRSIFPELSGCDISHESVAQARQDNPWVAYGHQQPGHLPYDRSSFDLAFAVCVVHHVPPAAWPNFFAEMKRVLRPGGVACIIEHNPLNPLTRLAVSRCPFDADAVLLGSGKTKRLLREGGFSEIASEHFLFFPFENPTLRAVERGLAVLPLGAQHACSARV